MSKKNSNKQNITTVRLSNSQILELDRISKELKVRKSALIRFAVDNLILQYENNESI